MISQISSCLRIWIQQEEYASGLGLNLSFRFQTQGLSGLVYSNLCCSKVCDESCLLNQAQICFLQPIASEQCCLYKEITQEQPGTKLMPYRQSESSIDLLTTGNCHVTEVGRVSRGTTRQYMFNVVWTFTVYNVLSKRQYLNFNTCCKKYSLCNLWELCDCYIFDITVKHRCLKLWVLVKNLVILNVTLVILQFQRNGNL